MTLQSFSHSSNGSLRASYPFGGVARSHARRDASAASRGFAAYSRVLWRLPLFAINGELASRLFKRGLTKVLVVAYESGRKSFDCIKIF